MLSLAASGAVDGVRIDHPDGLADPAGYFRRLQLRYAELAGLRSAPTAPGEPLAAKPLYVAIEKIVAPHEQVPADWAVHGTTGYRFANVVNGLLIDGAAKARLDRVWRAFVRDEAEDFDELSWRCRHAVMDGALAGELTVLSTALLRLAREDRRTRDFTLNHAAPDAGRHGGVVSGLSHLHHRQAERAGPPLHRLGDRPRAPAQPGRGRERLRLPAPRAARQAAARRAGGPGPSATTPSRGGCSSSPRRSPPRASRTPRCTATTG